MSALGQALDAAGPQQIRTAFTTAITTTAAHLNDLAGIAGVLGEAADRYETLQMAASTLDHLHDGAAAVTAAAAALATAGEQLQATLADFDARDHRVADAVAVAGNLMRPEAYTDVITGPLAPPTPPAPTGAVAALPRKEPLVNTPNDGTGADGTGRDGPGLMRGLGGDPDACLDWSVLHADGRRRFALNGAGPVDLAQEQIRRLRIQLARVIDGLPSDGTLHPAGPDHDAAGQPQISWDRAPNGNLRLTCGQGDEPAVAELTDAQVREWHARLGQQLDIDADLIAAPVATTYDAGDPEPHPPVAAPARVSGAHIDRPRRANGWGVAPTAGVDHFHPDGAIPRVIDHLGADATLDVDGDTLANHVADLATRGTLCRITPQEQVDELRALAARMPAGSTAARALTTTADDLDAPALDPPALPDGTAPPLAALVTALADVPSVRRDPDRELHPLLELIRSGRARGPLAGRRIRALINKRHESGEGKSYIDSLIRRAARDLESEASHTPAPPPIPRPADPDEALRRSQEAVKASGHTISPRQLAALHGLYKDLVKHSDGTPTVYGVSVRRQLEALADKGIIARTGANSYMIPFGSPGEQIIAAAPDFPVGAHLFASGRRREPRSDG